MNKELKQLAEAQLLKGFLQFIGKKNLYVEGDGTVWANAFNGGNEVDAISEYLKSEEIPSSEVDGASVKEGLDSKEKDYVASKEQSPASVVSLTATSSSSNQQSGKLTIGFEEFEGVECVMWIKEMKGMVESGQTKEEAFHHLMISLIAKIVYDNNIEFKIKPVYSIEQDYIMSERLYEVLEVLCDMWNQYCSGPYGHCFMSAGENCQDVLDKYLLLKNDKGTGGDVDWDRLKFIKTLLNQPN